MKLRRLAALSAAAVMSLALGLTVFAAPSPSVSGTVTKATGTDAEGKAVTVTFGEVDSSLVAELNSADKLKELLGDAYVDGMTVVDVKDVEIDSESFPVELTFEVPGVTASSKVAFLHYDGSAWEVVAATAGEGTMTGTFDSLSPVAFVVDKSAAATTTSPKTGESTMPIILMAVGVLAVGGVYVLSRKSRA